MFHIRLKLLRSVLALLGVTLICAAEAQPLASSAPTTIIIVRHAEKSAVSGDVPLSTEGHARALLLAKMLEPAGVSAIFSSELTFNRETALPLADLMKLAPTVIPVRETTRLVAELKTRPPGSVTLLVGHSGPMSDIVEQLGGVRPTTVDPQTYDRMFIITRREQAPASTIELRYGMP
jgi:broad specificity phosphatase PhoE